MIASEGRVGFTLIAMASGATPILFSPPAYCVGGILKKYSGATLALANGYGASSANSYVMGDTESIQFNGAARFFLCAGGATAVAGVILKFGNGESLFPPV